MEIVEPFVLQLSNLCTAQGTRAKWVLVPTHAIGRTLGDRLVLEGTDWLNLRFITPLELAVRMGAPFLVSRGIDPSAEGLGPALMMRLLLNLPGKGGYFRSLADQPTMAQALSATICEIRMAGVQAKDLAPDAFSSPAKHIELCALLQAYEEFLSRTGRGDVATVYQEAIQYPDWCPIQGADCWIEFPDSLWTVLQLNLLNALPGERIAPHVYTLAGAALPRRIAAARAERLAPDPSISPLAFLLAPEKASAPASLQLFRAGGRDAEIEEVFRRILGSGRTLDQIEISCPDPEYAALLWEKACRYDWPVTISAGIPATLTHPGRALLAFCNWIESNFSSGVLHRLLESGDITLGAVEGISPGQAARLLVKSRAGWGRDTYDLCLTRLVSHYQRVADDPGLSEEQRKSGAEKALRSEKVLGWISQIVATVPGHGESGDVSLQAVAHAVSEFVGSCAVRASALDAAAQVALRDAIGELRELGSFRCPLLIALGFVRDCVDRVSVGRDRPRPGHLHVSLLGQAAFANRGHLFVTGLEEGRLFPAAIEDPVLLDVERQRISPVLRCASDRIEEAVYAALSRLATVGAAAGVEVCFSYSCRDLREYRETFPSWMMLQAYRLQAADPSKTYRDLEAALGVPKSCVPTSGRKALSDSGWWLSGLKLAGALGADFVLEQYPALAQGLQAANARESATFGKYDGFVPAAGKVLDPCAREQPVSATQLEAAAECPFRHFLTRGLGLEAVGDGDRDVDVWLDPLVRGSELHDLYAAVLSKCRDEKRKPALKKEWPWLLTLTNKHLDALRTELPPPSIEVFEREKQDFLADVELFLSSRV